MNCSDHQRTINRFIDHEIKATECAELFEHLGTCAECRRFYDTITMLGGELEKIHSSIDEIAEAPWQPSVAASGEHMYRITDQKRIVPRPSTLAFVIVVMFVVSLLFSVNVTIEKPVEIMSTAAANQQ
ncbi:MAG: zf-HC2 domain-containing protein [Ignavibacteria bacterium]|nr:zf-HC2 domain-containing protein [Ignavibacteria bacterium]